MKTYQCYPKYGDFEVVVLANSKRDCIKKIKEQVCMLNQEWEEYDFENGFNIEETDCDIFVFGDTTY